MILICGASGLVGKEMCRFLDGMNVSYIGTYNTNKINKDNMFRINFADATEMEEFLIIHEITCCVFCIVERLTDVCENNWNETKKINVDLVHITSYLCNKLNIHFIHLSTDYVFDGSIQPNYPGSLKNPLQNYGISKLISEHRVIANCKRSCIIRTPVLYSSLSSIHDNAVCLIGKNVMDIRNTKTFKEDNYSIRRPLYISDMCHFIYDCITEEYTGIYHFYNPYNKYTKYDICKVICNYLERPIDKIIPNDSKGYGIAPRPYDTQLCDDRIEINKYMFTNFQETIVECFSKFKHPTISVDNKRDIFIMLDLDGTIVDTTHAHYNAYKRSFEKHNKKIMNIEEWNHIILNDHIDNYLKTNFNEDTVSAIKADKRIMLTDENITFTNNSELFLRYLIQNKFNFCIVTNTSKQTVDIFKQKLPILNDIRNWICREDYVLPKPSRECYDLAKSKYYKGEKHIIGFEDSSVGYKSLKHVTDIIYVYNNLLLFEKNDCYLFDDFCKLISQ